MARRGSTDYNKWASFDDEDDDPLAKLTIGNERRHPSLPKVVRKRPEAPRPARSQLTAAMPAERDVPDSRRSSLIIAMAVSSSTDLGAPSRKFRCLAGW